jgi:triosephosphate isomerase
MQTRKPFVAGNWKMNTTAASARELASAVAAGVKASGGVDVLVCPPFPYLGVVGEAIRGSAVMLGAQNCFHEKEGAFTGEVSPAMLLDLGCRYVILGHSERRHLLGETNEMVNQKVRCALGVGLRVIVCVGETLAERQAGKMKQVLQTQFQGSLALVGKESLEQLVLAYEPVWAIGTGQNATPEQAQEAHMFLRGLVAGAYGAEAATQLRILYGGSAKPGNVATLLAQPDVDGGLIGGASLQADQFLKIVEVAFPI